MEDADHRNNTYLIVNRAELLETGCSACGTSFATSAPGDRALIATVGKNNREFFFCGSCGDNIMSRVHNDETRGHYGWDWAVPLKSANAAGKPF